MQRCIYFVEVKLVERQVVQWAECRSHATRQLRLADVHEPGQRDAGHDNRNAQRNQTNMQAFMATLAESARVMHVVAKPSRRPDCSPDKQREHRQYPQRPRHHGRRFVRMMPGLRRKSLRAPKRQEIRAERVESGEERREHRNPKDPSVVSTVLGHMRRRVQRRKNFILAPKPGEQRHAGQRRRTAQKRPMRNRQHATQSTEAPHINHVAHRMHHATRRQEQ